MKLDLQGASRFAGGLPFFSTLLLVGLTCAGCEREAVAAKEEGADAPSLTMLFDSSEALAQAFLKALEEEDVEALRAFALTKEEFRHYVWPQLPSSRPENGVPFDYGWADLHQKSDNSLRRTYALYEGKRLEFLSIRFDDETTDYGTFLVHRDARVKVRDDKGRELWLDLFGSVIEWEGKFKLFSYVTD